MIARLFLGAAMVAALASGGAAAQRMPCGSADRLIAHLADAWGEAPAVLALDAAGRMVRILVNAETGTWSMLVTAPGGRTCLVTHRQAWDSAAPPRDRGDVS